jgi:DNA-binding MarR family transcriptional regulator
VLDLLRLVWAIDHELQTVSKRMAVTMGVTGPQRLVIKVLSRYPGISAGRLASILHLDPSTLSGILRRLESRGLVVRRIDPSDRRRVLLKVTSKARKVETASTGTAEAAVQDVLAELPARKLAVAREVLGALAESLRKT